ncbi:MAG TPA: hypothetical protein VK668_10405 [Mucilaginibacter sp.]|nr:hypothetical protein [Mucilaginibacter sp.]
MKILAVASAGGHWVQLMRLVPAFDNNEVAFLTTKKNFSDNVEDHEFHSVIDAASDAKFKLILMTIQIAIKILIIRPNVIITTGAAPGLLSLVWGKLLLGSRTIWVDSIANVEKISLSGKLAKRFADQVYTQWSHLEESEILYRGSIL